MTTHTYDKDLPKGFIPDEEEDDDLPPGFVPDDDKKKRKDGGTTSGTGSAGKSPSSEEVAEGIFSYKRQVARKPMPANPAAARQRDAQLQAARNVINQSSIGAVKPEELSEAFNSLYGKEEVDRLVFNYADDYDDIKAGKASTERWQQLAQTINETNVGNRKTVEEKGIADNDALIKDALVNFKAGVGIVRTPETHAVKTTSISVLNSAPLKNTDVNDPKQLGELYEQLEKANFVVGDDGEGNLERREQLMQAILEKQKYLVSKQGVNPEVAALNHRIGDAVAQVNRERELGENIDRSEDSDWLKNDEINSQHFQLGLSMLKDLKPGRYANIIRAINERGKIAKNDYTEIASIGQEINNIQTFRGAADDKSLIGKETSLDYSTDETRKVEYARIIGERARQQGITGREFSQEQIFKLGYDLPNKTTLKQLADEDQILGYDAIPKSGFVEAFVRGVQLPFAGIESTIRSYTESPAETYLRSRRTDVGVGGQKVADEKGQIAANLPSERGNIFLDAVNGFGQFIPQVLLTRGVGGVLNKALGTTGTALASGVTNYGGTAISTYFQTYGDAYADALDKTGDVGTAKLMGNIGGVSAAAFELLLPDVKIASRAFSGLQKTLAKDLMDVVRKGGDLDALAKAGRPAIQKFVKEALSITGQEVAEEEGTKLVDYITESIFSPRTAQDRDLAEELMETAKATAISMSIPAIFGGAGAARRKDFTENAFHAAAINFNEYASALNNQYKNGNISKDEHDKALTLLSTHKQSIDTKPTEDANGKRLNGQQQLDYALEETKIKTNKEKAKNVSGVQKEVFEKNIKQSEDIQRGILMPEPTQRRAVQAETDQWKQNIAAIEDRTDITPEQKEQLKQAEDARHAQAISSLINKPKIQSDANVQKDQKRDDETKDTQKVQRQTDGESVKDSQVQQEKVVKTEGAAVAAAAPSFEDTELLEKLRSNAPDTVKDANIDYFIDKVGEDPANFIETHGLGTSRKLLQKIPVEKLKANSQELKDKFGESETTDFLDQIVKQREAAEAKAAEQTKASPTEQSQKADVVPSLKEYEDKKADIEKMWREELEANPVPDLTEDSSSYDERSKVYDKRKDINEKYKAQLAALEKTKPEQTKVSPTPQSQKEDVVPSLKDKSDSEIENMMTELGSGKEFNELEKEMEARERDSVFKVPLSEAESAVDNLLKKEKEQPNGWGAFIEKKDAAQTKQVIRDYSNPKELSDALIKKDFKDALMGEPATWYADGMKLRESMKEAANRGIDIDTLLKEVEGVYIKDGVDQQAAKQIIARKLQSVYEGSTKPSPTTETKKRPTTKAEIDALPDEEKDAAIDALIYGDEVGEQAPDETDKKTAVKIEAIPANGTVESTLKLIADSGNEFSDLAKEILRTTDKKSLAAKVKVQRRPSGRSVYLTSKDEIVIDPSSKQDARVIMHEIVHGTTSRKIPNDLKNPSHGNSYGKAYLKGLQNYLKNSLGRPEIKRLINLYLKAAKELGYEKQLFEGGEVSKRFYSRVYESGNGIYIAAPDMKDAEQIKNALKDVVGENNVRVFKAGAWQVLVNRGEGVNRLKASDLYKEEDVLVSIQKGDERRDEVQKRGSIQYQYRKRQNATAGNADLTVERGVPYGMGNLDEFLAEAFTNPKFQEQLEHIKDEDGVTLWKRFIDAVKKIIGMDINNTLLSSVIKNGAEIIARERDAVMQLSLDLQSPVNIEAASQRMREAGYSEAEIKAEFQKRGLAYKEKRELSKADADKVKGIEDQRQKELSGLLKPTVNVAIDDIDPEKVAQHEDAFALKDEILKLDDEISELKQLVNCVYG